jgi:hypothetical protein
VEKEQGARAGRPAFFLVVVYSDYPISLPS